MAQSPPHAPTSNLTLRLLSAAVGLPLLGIVLWRGGLVLEVVAVAAVALALYEALSLLHRAGWDVLRAEGVAWGSAIVAVIATRPSALWTALLVGGAAIFVVAVVRHRFAAPGSLAFTAFGVAYVALPLASVVALRAGPAGLEWLLIGFLATFATDTGAYTVGKLIGRHRLAPSISPGKTWEGAVGGLLAGVGATVALVALLPGVSFVVWAAVLLGVGIAVAAQVGDLLESKLKRLAGAKDSGKLIPGHGGLLDRLDSLVLVFPLVYYASQVWRA